MQDNLENIYELSPLQQGLLIETLNKPDTDTYTIQFVLTLDAAELNVVAFRKAWQTVLNRHAVLRSAFYWQDLDKPVQVVLREVELPWEEHDWCDHDDATQWATWQETDLKQPFALDAAPLFRCNLIRSDNETYRFVWTVHHLINDGWSYPILLNEVLSLYQAEVTGKPLALPMPRPFVDYIEWLQQQDMAQAERFWCEQLSGFTETTPLGASKPTATGQADYQTQHLLLSSEQTEQLRTFAQHHRLTMNTLLQGTWALLLARYGAGNDVVFGGMVSGRPATLPGVDAMVGMFTNTVPVRIKLEPNASLLPWLQTLQQQQLEREQFAHCSLVDIQGWSDVPRGSPLFESIFAYENYPLQASWEEMGFIKDMSAVERVPYPLSFVAMLHGVMELHVHFDAIRFSSDMMTRLLGHFQTLLMGMVNKPHLALWELPLLTQAEYQQLSAWNDTAIAYPADKTIAELFEEQVMLNPDNVALTFSNQQMTYRQLNERANQLANYLLETYAVQVNTLIGLCLERSADMIVGILGVVKAGCAYVPLDVDYPADRLMHMLNDTNVKVVLTQSLIRERLCQHSVNLLCLDTDGVKISKYSTQSPEISTTSDSLAYVTYTSGSTGIPKGVAIPQKSVVRLVCSTDYIHFKPTDVVAQASSIAFDAATFEIWGALLNGARLVGLNKQQLLNPSVLAHSIRTENVSILFVTTALFNQVVLEAPEIFAPLRYLLFGGEAVNPFCVKQVLKADPPEHLLHVYGPTENTTFSTWYEVTQADADAHSVTIPIGRAIANSRVYVLDANQQLVPPYIPGELYVAGDGLAVGYWNRPELTADKFIEIGVLGKIERLYRTGDIVRWNANGHLEYLARIDNQVKLRGFRIELGEIETTLVSLPLVQDAVVLLHDVDGNKSLIAYVIVKHSQEITESLDVAASLQDYLALRLPSFMIPANFIVLDKFPLTPNGKVNSQALMTLLPDLRSVVSPTYPPSSVTEQRIVNIWQDVLRLPIRSIHDSFFELGGHSLLATQVISRLSQAFGLDIPFHYLFEHPTVAGLAVHIDTLLRTQALMLDDADGLDEEEMELL